MLEGAIVFVDRRLPTLHIGGEAESYTLKEGYEHEKHQVVSEYRYDKDGNLFQTDYFEGKPICRPSIMLSQTKKPRL